MKKIASFAAAVFAVGLFSSGAMAADEPKGQTEQGQSQQQKQLGQEQQQPSQQEGQVAGAQQQQQQKQIQAIEDIKGFKVQNQQGEELGEVSELLVDVDQGKVGYAVVTSGGVMGMGEEKYIVPFNALQLDQQKDKALTLDMDKEKLKQAPKGDVAETLDRSTGREIHQFYGVSPYWEEGAQQQQQQEQQTPQQQMQREQIQQRDQIQEREQIPQRDQQQR